MPQLQQSNGSLQKGSCFFLPRTGSTWLYGIDKNIVIKTLELLLNVKTLFQCLLYGKELIRKRDRDYLHRVNHEEVERLVERSMSDDIKVQALKFIQKRMEIKERRKAKL